MIYHSQFIVRLHVQHEYKTKQNKTKKFNILKYIKSLFIH